MFSNRLLLFMNFLTKPECFTSPMDSRTHPNLGRREPPTRVLDLAAPPPPQPPPQSGFRCRQRVVGLPTPRRRSLHLLAAAPSSRNSTPPPGPRCKIMSGRAGTRESASGGGGKGRKEEGERVAKLALALFFFKLVLLLTFSAPKNYFWEMHFLHNLDEVRGLHVTLCGLRQSHSTLGGVATLRTPFSQAAFENVSKQKACVIQRR